MHVVGATELDAASHRIRQPTPFDERGWHRQADQRKPAQDNQVNAGEDPEARYAHRKERDESDGERDREVATAMDRPDQRDRACVRRGERERSRCEDDGGTRRIVKLRGGDADEGRADSERERGPEPGAVEPQ